MKIRIEVYEKSIVLITSIIALSGSLGTAFVGNSLPIWMIVIIGATAFILLTFYFSSFKVRQKVKEQYPNLSVVGIILRRKQQKTSLATTFLLLALLVSIIPSYFTELPLNYAISLGTLGLALLVMLRGYLVNYRVRKGLYGTNEYEAREIIQFLIDHRDDIDFTDGGRPKKIITDADLETLETRVRETLGTPIPA